MTKSRAVRRKKIKSLQKELKNRISKVKKTLENIPETCKACDNKFVKEGKKCLDWKINVSTTSGITVVCPECVKKIEDFNSKNG